MANKKLPAENQTLKNVIYILIQCTWGLPQTLLGFIVLLINIKNKHYFYHGAIITERNVPSSVSLGMFVFTTTNPMKDKRTKNKIPDEELSKRLLVHEYWTVPQTTDREIRALS